MIALWYIYLGFEEYKKASNTRLSLNSKDVERKPEQPAPEKVVPVPPKADAQVKKPSPEPVKQKLPASKDVPPPPPPPPAVVEKKTPPLRPEFPEKKTPPKAATSGMDATAKMLASERGPSAKAPASQRQETKGPSSGESSSASELDDAPSREQQANPSLLQKIAAIRLDIEELSEGESLGSEEEAILEETLRSMLNPSKKMVDAAVLEKLEAGFKKLEASDSKSLLKKYLTRDVFDRLKNLKTPSFGSTLLDVIQSGVENLDSGVGIYAPDAEAYTVFADLFDPIIEDYHGGFKKTDKHPAKDWGDVDSMGNLDPNGEFIISTRVRCGRSLQGYPFNPCLTEAQYKEMEDKMSSTLSGLQDELKGTYYPLTGMTKEVQQKLIDDHFLFKEGDRFLQAANACRFWPTGRGIYHNDAKTFLVWCNEEDHLRIISMQMGGDLGQVYRRLVTAVNDIEKRVPFSHHDRLGFLTFCPTNLGTTVRASVHIKVPKLAANKAKLEEIAGKFNLQVRGTRGEHTEAEGGVYDISNKRRMGLTEYQAVKEMNDGIAELIKMEREL